jgi:AraC family transcriptional regulator, transcriptional activator of pobA
LKRIFTTTDGQGQLILIAQPTIFEKDFYVDTQTKYFHTIAWNIGPTQMIKIDEIYYAFEENTVLPIMLNQSFEFENASAIIAWQFNREFYCIVNHDQEVGCVGFLFFGPSPTMFVKLDAEDKARMEKVNASFVEEFDSNEDIKGEMLRMLLVRLIITITRLAKKQYLGTEEVVDEKFNLIRQFNLLVEIHFRTEHQIKFYASQLNKSPKTISNYFSLYSKKSPLQIIQERIITEAKRLFYYTDKSVKEISSELGFEDVAHFSKFFKKMTSQNPSELKKKP